MITQGEPPRGAAVLAARRRLFQLDEFGQFLGDIVNTRHAPKHLAEIRDLMTEIYTSAGGTFFWAEHAERG